MKVLLMPDARHVLITGPTWSELMPVADLDRRLRFYRGLWGRGASKPGNPGPYARFYAEIIAGLEAVQREIRVQGAAA